MRLLISITACLLLGSAYAAPTFSNVVTQEFFKNLSIIYTSEHDIVKIVMPLNALNLQDNRNESTASITIFFVEADIKENGEQVEQGLHVLSNGIATKLLDNGRDIAFDIGAATDAVYFAAKDGIYIYNAEKNKAEKYGTVTDDLISIAKVSGSDVIYVVTKDNVLYKVTGKGTKKDKVNNVVNAKQIVLDYQNNLFYTTTDNKVYVLVGDEVKKIEGLPLKSGPILILRPVYDLTNQVIVVIDNYSYKVYKDGRSEYGQFALSVKPTAYSAEAAVYQFYGYDKNIYERSFFKSLFGSLLGNLKIYFDAITSAMHRANSRK